MKTMPSPLLPPPFFDVTSTLPLVPPHLDSLFLPLWDSLPPFGEWSAMMGVFVGTAVFLSLCYGYFKILWQQLYW